MDKDGDIAMGSESEPSPFAPFSSELDWRVAQWAVKDGPGHNAFDRLLKIPGVSKFCLCLKLFSNIIKVVEKLGLSYHNIRGLHQKLDEMPEKGGKWKTENLRFKDRPNELFTLRYRDPVEAIQSLWKDSQLSPEMVFASRKIFSDKTCQNRIFTEMWTGKWWPALQVKIMLILCSFLLLTSFLGTSSKWRNSGSCYYCNR